MDWKHLSGISALCRTLCVLESDFRIARSQASWIYVEKAKRDAKSGKIRHLCYPPDNSMLYDIQGRLKENVLTQVELLPEVRGYLKNSHNIEIAAEVSGHRYVGKVDVSGFHPNTTRKHVEIALSKHGFSASWCREIARIATYKDSIPQGAPSSNHLANVVMDSILRRFVKQMADRLQVGFRNYGDDVAFFGDDRDYVRRCVGQMKRALKEMGYATNDKGRDCQHRGERRVFIGCSTNRQEPNFPRDRYRALRKELRQLLHVEQQSEQRMVSGRQLRSVKYKIAYIKRLSRKKGRGLSRIFYKLCTEYNAKRAYRTQFVQATTKTAEVA